MLDKKIEDYDASVELLEDRKKTAKFFMLFFYFIGLLGVICFPIIAIVDSWMSGEYVVFISIGLLIIAGFMWKAILQYEFYLFMIKKKLVKAKDKRD